MFQKSKHTITLSIQVCIADGIGGRLRVLASIDFDHDLLFSTNEVANIRAYVDLPCELAAVDLPIANTIPQYGFGVGLIDA